MPVAGLHMAIGLDMHERHAGNGALEALQVAAGVVNSLDMANTVNSTRYTSLLAIAANDALAVNAVVKLGITLAGRGDPAQQVGRCVFHAAGGDAGAFGLFCNVAVGIIFIVTVAVMRAHLCHCMGAGAGTGARVVSVVCAAVAVGVGDIRLADNIAADVIAHAQSKGPVGSTLATRRAFRPGGAVPAGRQAIAIIVLEILKQGC